MLRIENISYGAGRAKILDMVSCNILPGELTVLLGANGAGKSTLLRLLSGERAPHTGRIWWGHRLLHKIAAAELARRRAVLTQHTVVTLPFTVEEIVLMGRYPHFQNSPSAKDRTIVTACLEEMKVRHLSVRHYNTLSGGEQQRVQMARVLAQLYGWQDGHAGDSANGMTTRTGMLLLDEPSLGLAPKIVQDIFRVIGALRDRGIAILLVEQNARAALQMADYGYVLEMGRVALHGPCATLAEDARVVENYLGRRRDAAARSEGRAASG